MLLDNLAYCTVHCAILFIKLWREAFEIGPVNLPKRVHDSQCTPGLPSDSEPHTLSIAITTSSLFHMNLFDIPKTQNPFCLQRITYMPISYSPAYNNANKSEPATCSTKCLNCWLMLWTPAKLSMPRAWNLVFLQKGL